jgi:hypothetical protein
MTDQELLISTIRKAGQIIGNTLKRDRATMMGLLWIGGCGSALDAAAILALARPRGLRKNAHR